MTTEQQIAAIRAALAAIEAAIAQTETALRMAATPADVLGLTAALADLRAERTRLQFQLANLEAAAVVVRPLGAETVAPRAAGARGAGRARGGPSGAEMKALEKKLTNAVTDRAVVAAALDFATDVAKMARTVRMIGDNPARRRRRRATGSGK